MRVMEADQAVLFTIDAMSNDCAPASQRKATNNALLGLRALKEVEEPVQS